MRQVQVTVLAVSCVALVSGCGAAADDSEIPMVAPAAPSKTSPARVRDAKGHVLTWQRQVEPTAEAIQQSDETPRSAIAEPLQLADDELSEALRPIMRVGSNEYRGEPARELVKAVRNGRVPHSLAPHRPASMKEVDPNAVGREIGIKGNDDRELRRDNTSYPMSTVVDLHYNTSWSNNETECSGTVVGASTIITSAHCVHDGANWRTLPNFSPGTDWQDGSWNHPAGTYPWGIHSCYSVIIPTGFITGTAGKNNGSFDYAVVEFSYCNDYLGNSTGWKGIWVYGDTDLSAATPYLYGHPDSKTQPQIWGMMGTAGALIPNGNFIDHVLDATHAESGSGLYTYNGGTPYVLGIDKGAWTDESGNPLNNYAVRINDSVLQFILDNSAL